MDSLDFNSRVAKDLERRLAKKTRVTNGNLVNTANTVVRATMLHFGSDIVRVGAVVKWNEEVDPWMDKFIEEKYVFASTVTLGVLNQEITRALARARRGDLKV